MSSHPKPLELAYMVNLEYSIDRHHKRLRDIPDFDLDDLKSCIKVLPFPKEDDDEDKPIRVKEMVAFLKKNNWELASHTSHKGFKCSSFVNQLAKQLVIVHRGTQNLEQVMMDIRLALDEVTQEDIENACWHTAQALFKHGLERQRQDGREVYVRNEYSVTIVGHSLGGWLAQICTLLFRYPKFHPTEPPKDGGRFWRLCFPGGQRIRLEAVDFHCVAFDSPGADKVLKRLDSTRRPGTAYNLLSGFSGDIETAFRHLDITVYVSLPRNPINLYGKQVGKVIEVKVLRSKAKLSEELNPIASHSMDKILKYFIRVSSDKKKPELKDPIRTKTTFPGSSSSSTSISSWRLPRVDPIQLSILTRTESNPISSATPPVMTTEAADVAAALDPFGIGSAISKTLSGWKW